MVDIAVLPDDAHRTQPAFAALAVVDRLDAGIEQGLVGSYRGRNTAIEHLDHEGLFGEKGRYRRKLRSAAC